MAKRKGLDFIVEDETTATDAGLNKIVKGSKIAEEVLVIDNNIECEYN